MKVMVILAAALALLPNFSQAGDIDYRALQSHPAGPRHDEFLLDTGVVSLPGIGEQRQPAVAFDGMNYLVAWTDYRNGSPVICGSRMDQEGNLLDEGIIMPLTGDYQCSPSIAFDGTNYLVVWRGYHGNAMHNPVNKIFGARVSPAGVLLDTAAIMVSDPHGDIYQNIAGGPQIAFAVNSYLVVWTEDFLISGIHVSPEGIVLDSAAIPIHYPSRRPYTPSLVFGGSYYLISWVEFLHWPEDSNKVYCARLLTSGTMVDTPSCLASAGAGRMINTSVSFDGTNYLCLWEYKYDTPYRLEIWGTRVNQAGIILEPGGIGIATNTVTQRRPQVAFDGVNYLVVWEDRRNGSYNFDIYGTRVTTAGVVLDPQGIPIATRDSSQVDPAVVCGNGQYLVAWQDGRNKKTLRNDIYASRVSTSGAVLDPGGIPVQKRFPALQTNPSVAFDGTHYLAVWQDYRNSSFPLLRSEIFGMRISESGNVLDSAASPIAKITSDSFPMEEYINPILCYGGSRYLMICDNPGRLYQEPMVIKGMFIDTIGMVSDTFFIQAASGDYFHASLAFGDTTFLLTWSDWGNGIMGYRITQTGTILDSNGFLIDTSNVWCDLKTIWGNSNFMVLWAWNGIQAKRVAVDGTVLDPYPFYYPSLVDISVAFDGNNYFIVGSKWWGTPTGILGYRVNQNGILLDTNMIMIADIPVQPWLRPEFEPTVAFDGTNYIVAWSALHDSISYDLYSAKVSPQGQVISVVKIVDQAGDQCEPVLCRGNADQMLLVYTGWTNNVNGHPASTQRIWGKTYPFYGLEEKSLTKDLEINFLTVQPNPFRNRAVLEFNPGSAQRGAGIKIYDVTGREVRSYDVRPAEQRSSVVWDSRDDQGRKVAAGVYFVRMEAGDRHLVQKMVLLK